ncbi:LmbU family transcriptional regulator [Herbidospora yilanensis]|uniref:LmbU family transcriptional regulator n=1 Tax=Herbidospora yilanensis TaxID=354426 RepID=UPI000ACC7334|nr:LmbU family transcriptional regulator [Herbidospora yilanensis]
MSEIPLPRKKPVPGRDRRIPQAAGGPAHGLGLDRAVIPRRTGLQFPTHIPLSNWEGIGRQLSLIADSSAWWLGDWLVYGEKQYGDRYRAAIERTSLDYQTLRNYAWVARRFGLSRRRDKLSFAHHAEVAALTPADQDAWLQRAEEQAWSRNRLRKEIRQAAMLKNGQVPDDASETSVKVQLNPSQEQLERWERAAREQNCDLANWMVLALETYAREITSGDAVVPELESAGA